VEPPTYFIARLKSADFKRRGLRCALRLGHCPAEAMSCDARFARSIFAENAVSGKNNFILFRACGHRSVKKMPQR
jgi:hypothetical protein